MKLNMFRNGWASIGLVAAGIPLAVIGIWSAGMLDDSISTMAVGIFASILIFSLVVNGAVMLAVRPGRPLLLVSPAGVPLVQAVLLALEGVWIGSILMKDAVVAILASVAIASISTAVFVIGIVIAVTPDGHASARSLARAQARAAARDARTAADRRLRRIRAGVITGVLFAAVAVPVTVVQTTVTVYPGCAVNGAFYSGSTVILSSTNCGDFAQPGDEADYDELAGRYGTFDIVTRGYWLGHPLLVELRPVSG